MNNAVKVDKFFIAIFVGHVIRKSCNKSLLVTCHGRRTAVQMPRRYFRSTPERMQAFLTAINMSSPQVRVASVSMERKSSYNSKLEERQQTEINNCAESLISVD